MTAIVWLVIGAMAFCVLVPLVAFAVVLLGMALNLAVAFGLWVLGLFAPRRRS